MIAKAGVNVSNILGPRGSWKLHSQYHHCEDIYHVSNQAINPMHDLRDIKSVNFPMRLYLHIPTPTPLQCSLQLFTLKVRYSFH